MTYLHKLESEPENIKYEYGSAPDDYVGVIKMRIDVPKDTSFEGRDVTLSYYGDNTFCRHTSSALQGIAKFIKEGNFPERYCRATH